MLRTGKSLKNRLAVSSFIAIFLWASLSSAEMKVFPMWERMACPDIEYACYSFEQAKQILELDLDMQLKLEKLKLTESQVVDLRLALGELKKASEHDQVIIKRLEDLNKEKTKDLNNMTHSYIRAQKRDVFGGALPWVVLVVLAAFGGGAVLGFFAANK